MQHHEPKSILLAVKPGIFRNALQNLLSTMQGFDFISLTGDLDAALTVVQSQQPTVVLVDIALFQREPNYMEELFEAVGRMGGRCIVITQNVRQQHLLERLGTVRAVVRGTHPHELVKIIEALPEGKQLGYQSILTRLTHPDGQFD